MSNCYFFFFLLFCFQPLFALPLSIDVHGKAVVLINGKTGQILFEKEKDLLIYPASTTKIATALFVLEVYEERLVESALGTKEALATISAQVKRESNYRCPPYWLENDGKHMSIKNGELLPMKELLYALLINSPNDAANVIASHISGSVSQFMEDLNGYFKSIGLVKTHFVNPHGLHHPMHMTTAKEMALLGARAIKHPLFRDIVLRSSYKFPQTNLEYERILAQTNALVKRGAHHYPYAIGIKTGTTKAAGKCLVAAAEKEGRLLVASLFGYGKREELYGDAIKLFERAFAEKKRSVILLPEGMHPFKGEVFGKKRALIAILPKALQYDFYPSERESVYVHLKMDVLKLPMYKGEKMGELLIKNRAGEILGREAIFTAKNIRAGLFVSMKNYTRWKRVYIVIGGAALFMLSMKVFKKKRRSRY